MVDDGYHCATNSPAEGLSMIVIEGTVRIPDGRLESARPAMEAMIAASRAEAGCHEYAYSVDLLDGTLIRINERWETRAALDDHVGSAHMAEWRSAASKIGVTDHSLRLYDADAEAL
jgi:quinol monooxygenase YgiN